MTARNIYVTDVARQSPSPAHLLLLGRTWPYWLLYLAVEK